MKDFMNLWLHGFEDGLRDQMSVFFINRSSYQSINWSSCSIDRTYWSKREKLTIKKPILLSRGPSCWWRLPLSYSIGPSSCSSWPSSYSTELSFCSSGPSFGSSGPSFCSSGPSSCSLISSCWRQRWKWMLIA